MAAATVWRHKARAAYLIPNNLLIVPMRWIFRLSSSVVEADANRLMNQPLKFFEQRCHFQTSIVLHVRLLR